ncbi:Splicing factor [Spraguea lophii 42_110]|uniref:Splicing factor n=1 Tax=Spraguea lophii (strain 42_110) TaxID=1358809 RepID=S7WCM1_SPRLO|nr:Splicing factor [Spraguea lophii 42_110]
MVDSTKYPFLKNLSIENYLLLSRIENIRLKLNNLKDECIYENIDDYRSRLLSLYHRLIYEAKERIPHYKLPSENTFGGRYQHKLHIPVDKYPSINFIGLIIGPSGNSLKEMEYKNNIKISIKGKGAYKEESNEDLHCLITADKKDNLDKGVEEIEKIIEDAIKIPENENVLKNKQLKEMGVKIEEKNKMVYTDWEKYYYWWYYFNREEN